MSMANDQLAHFLAHSVELESEAHERYLELAESLAAHYNWAVADFFRRMAHEAELHLAEVSQLAAGMQLPRLKAWEFEWPGEEAPESASYEAVHYRMSLRQAITLALANERAAERYYRQVANDSSDPETARIAAQFADEETSHAEALLQKLKKLPDNGPLLHLDDDAPHMPE
jgi:rubrerythrin